MYLVSVIPINRILLPSPQILTYFSAHELSAGGLVLVPVGRKKVPGVVLSSQDIKGQKMKLRKADFTIRGILKVITEKPFLSKEQIRLGRWISSYYWAPLGVVIKKMIPDKIKNYEIMNHARTAQTLVLVPEISSVQQLSKQYDTAATTFFHSGLTDKQHLESWQKIGSGQAKIIIGTRSALFAPFINLKKIIIEKEHSANYKSQRAPRLNTRETALKLAEIWNAKIELKSQVPSIETFWLSENKNKCLSLDIQQSSNPAIQLVDLRQELKEKNFSIFSRLLQERLKNIIQDKKQAILFINRRGASTFLLCRDCGHVLNCPNCDVPMVCHLSPLRLICHHCNRQETPPALCPACQGSRIKFFGAGTQKVETEFKKLFPDVPTARLDSDIVKSAERPETKSLKRNLVSKEKQIIDDFTGKKIRILIGTQMILNKNLGPVPLVAIISADTLLHLPDFRSNERTFQIIGQLKNLSNNNFIIQTYTPENTAIQAVLQNDFQALYQEEIKSRKALSYPPFTQLIKLTFQHKDNTKATGEAKILAEKLKLQISHIYKKSKEPPFISLLGPAPAYIPKVRGKYIWQIIIKSAIRDLNTRNRLLEIIPPSWTVDVDPMQII